VLLADWIQRGMHYTRDDVFGGRRSARDDRRVALRLRALRVARAVAGSRLLDDFLARLHPLDSQIGASLPSFALSFALASVVWRGRATGRRRRREG
jgi:hypothetical protein